MNDFEPYISADGSLGLYSKDFEDKQEEARTNLFVGARSVTLRSAFSFRRPRRQG